ncbi:hypothetical protein BS78_06G017400 [Paspalum vaginatum]|nr:hypothetical protein BS78_06G017400 [Paspalum vaginatum]
MASEHASGVDQHQDVVRLLSSLECDMAVQTGVLKQYGKLQDAVKAFLEEKVKNTHEKQEVERLQEELANKNKDLTLKMETMQSMNQLLSRENHLLSMKNENLSRENKDLSLKLEEKLVETESLKRSILSGHNQGVLTGSMCTQKVQECVEDVTADDELEEESFDPVLTNRIIAEDCERRRELSEIRKK